MMECIHIRRGKRSRLGALHCSSGCTEEYEQLRLLIYHSRKNQETLDMQTLCMDHWLRTVIAVDTKCDSDSQFIFLYLIPFFFCSDMQKPDKKLAGIASGPTCHASTKYIPQLSLTVTLHVRLMEEKMQTYNFYSQRSPDLAEKQPRPKTKNSNGQAAQVLILTALQIKVP